MRKDELVTGSPSLGKWLDIVDKWPEIESLSDFKTKQINKDIFPGEGNGS